jgi:hypothetical protein
MEAIMSFEQAINYIRIDETLAAEDICTITKEYGVDCYYFKNGHLFRRLNGKDIEIESIGADIISLHRFKVIQLERKDVLPTLEESLTILRELQTSKAYGRYFKCILKHIEEEQSTIEIDIDGLEDVIDEFDKLNIKTHCPA